MANDVQHFAQDDVKDHLQNEANTPDDIMDIEDDIYHSKGLGDLPTELLVKIMSYLPTRDRIVMRYVCRKFQEVSEVPSFWKEFVWPYGPRQVSSVGSVLKKCGVHTRRIIFPAHVTSTKILEMANSCTKVTHLGLSRDTQLSLDDLEEILHIMTQLQQLDMFVPTEFIYLEQRTKFIEGLLKTVASVSQLKLRTDNPGHTVSSIKVCAVKGNPLPSIVNILTCVSDKIVLADITSELHLLWSNSNSDLSAFEVGLYDDKRIPMHPYPPVPLISVKLGQVAMPPLIRFSDHGVVGLQNDIFFISEYDYCGTVRHTITPFKYSPIINEKHFNSTSHSHSFSCVDLSRVKVSSNHLEQLAVACPNLQRLNLKDNINCLEDVQGLHAIVSICQNLEGLNLAGISVSSVESSLLIWELLSSLKKLTHLAINLCVLKPCDLDDGSKCKLINMLATCHGLQDLEIHCHFNRLMSQFGQFTKRYEKCCSIGSSNADFLFSHFLSLTHCRMYDFQYSGLRYAIANCRKLKYLYEKNAYEADLISLSNNCHLQQLFIKSSTSGLTDKLVEALSAHGGLECVVLYVNSITINGIITLINNSPNLILLRIIIRMPLQSDDRSKIDYTDRIRNMFSYRKLFVVGSFEVCYVDDYSAKVLPNDITLMDTHLNSLWV